MSKPIDPLKKESAVNGDCFVIMPISDTDGYEKGHFQKVYEDILKPACSKAGYTPIRADDVKQTNFIHLDILQKLLDSPMAICDLSSRNPNVLFELGLRQAFDKPTVLVQDVETPKIFDIAPLRYTEYRKELRYREVIEDQEAIKIAISATKDAVNNGTSVNSIVKILSLSKPAALEDISKSDPAGVLQLLRAEISELRSEFRKTTGPREPHMSRQKSVNRSILSHEIIIDCQENLSEISSLIETDAALSLIIDYIQKTRKKLANALEVLPPWATDEAFELLFRIDEMEHRAFKRKGGPE